MEYPTTDEHKSDVSSGTICKNCARWFEGQYCYNCGQCASTSRIMTRTILQDTLFSVVQINRGFFFTAKELCLRPGKAILRYLEGKRITYYPPHKYLFFIGAVTSFLTSRYHSFSKEFMIIDSFSGDTLAFLSEFFKYADLYITLVNVIAIPAFALFSFLLFSQSGHNYAENLVLNTYITSQQLLLFIGWLPFTRVISMQIHWLIGLYVLLTLGYNFWVYLQFFRVYTVASFLRVIAAMGLAYLGQFLLNLLFFRFGGMYL
jgi:hypothetical protein